MMCFLCNTWVFFKWKSVCFFRLPMLGHGETLGECICQIIITQQALFLMFYSWKSKRFSTNSSVSLFVMGLERWGVVKQCVQWCCQTSQHCNCCRSMVVFVPLCSQISQCCCGRRIIFVPLCSQISQRCCGRRILLFLCALKILTTEAHLVHWCSQNSHKTCRSTSCSLVLSEFSQQLQKHILFTSALKILKTTAAAHLVCQCSQNSHKTCRRTSCSLVLSVLTTTAEAHLVHLCSQNSLILRWPSVVDGASEIQLLTWDSRHLQNQKVPLTG